MYVGVYSHAQYLQVLLQVLVSIEPILEKRVLASVILQRIVTLTIFVSFDRFFHKAKNSQKITSKSLTAHKK